MTGPGPGTAPESAPRPVADVDFTCTDVVADRFAAGPTVVLRMRAEERSGVRVHALALRCQVRIEPLRRHYNDREAARVVDLFGERPRWGATMQPLQLAFLSHVLPGFTGECAFDLALPVSYDVDVAAHKLLAGLDEGAAPLLLLFSGQVFTGRPGSIAVEPVPWHKETTARLPVAVWREAMDAHFPDQAWLRVSRDTHDRLSAYRGRHGLLGWDDVLGRLLDEDRT
ncbi:DUF6084 family protein [Nocardioides sp. MAHUQ-72]|uniref:DUF6084 family protein n=1 Tax=unclassified Nocardioides TaxID=2615069 RepID=UPI0036225DA5